MKSSLITIWLLCVVNVLINAQGGDIIVFADKAVKRFCDIMESCMITVKKAEVNTEVTGLVLDKTSLTLMEYDSEKITATILPETSTNKGVSWTTSDKSIATVANDGTVKAIKQGNATITCRAKGNENISATCYVTVIPIEATGISLNKTSLTVETYQTKQVSVTVLPENTRDRKVIWESSDPKIAEVIVHTDEHISVSGINHGNAVITCSLESNPTIKASCMVAVVPATPKVTKIELEPTSLIINVPFGNAVTPTISPSEARDRRLIWTVADTTIAIVKGGYSAGVIGVRPGKTTLTCTSVNNPSVSLKSAT